MPRLTQTQQAPEGGVQAVVLAFQIVEHLAARNSATGITELATLLGTTKTRIYNYLQTLQGMGYVAQEEETDRYRIGNRLLQLGSTVGRHLDLRTVSRPVMQRLRDSLGHTVTVARFDADGLHVLDRIEGTFWLEIGVTIGSTLDLHTTAQGKLVLAFGPEATLKGVERSTLKPLTDRTITSQKRLRAQVDMARKKGWADAPGETLTGLNALAAPIFEGTGKLVGTIAILGSIDTISSPPTQRQVTEVVEAAAQISNVLAGLQARE